MRASAYSKLTAIKLYDVYACPTHVNSRFFYIHLTRRALWHYIYGYFIKSDFIRAWHIASVYLLIREELFLCNGNTPVGNLFLDEHLTRIIVVTVNCDVFDKCLILSWRSRKCEERDFVWQEKERKNERHNDNNLFYYLENSSIFSVLQQ